MLNKQSLEGLKLSLGHRLRSYDQIAPPPGVSTGWPQLDGFLLWRGMPKGAVSLLISEAGGATTLWIQAAAKITQQQQWVAWVGGSHSRLTPWSLRHKKVDLSKLLYVSHPTDARQTLWVMQELMSLCLFELIGCDLDQNWFKEHQILQLKKLAMRYQTAVVLLTTHRAQQVLKSSFYSLILHFHQSEVIVHRALYRPTPHILPRRDLYADTLPQLAAGRRALCG